TMLRITVELFSGRANPTWILPEAEVTPILRDLARDRAALVGPAVWAQDLGFRGVLVETLTDGLAARYGLPPALRLASGRSLAEGRSIELAERLIGTMGQDLPSSRSGARDR